MDLKREVSNQPQSISTTQKWTQQPLPGALDGQVQVRAEPQDPAPWERDRAEGQQDRGDEAADTGHGGGADSSCERPGKTITMHYFMLSVHFL